MRFLVDAQLPPALVQLLREHGHEAEHVTEIGPADASDSELWRYALDHDAAIVTKDEDFAALVATGARHRRSYGPHSQHTPRGLAGVLLLGWS
jgi:predicted nuclease of predicted toxin-antitoxin system